MDPERGRIALREMMLSHRNHDADDCQPSTVNLPGYSSGRVGELESWRAPVEPKTTRVPRSQIRWSTTLIVVRSCSAIDVDVDVDVCVDVHVIDVHFVVDVVVIAIAIAIPIPNPIAAAVAVVIGSGSRSGDHYVTPAGTDHRGERLAMPSWKPSWNGKKGSLFYMYKPQIMQRAQCRARSARAGGGGAGAVFK